MKTLPRHNTAHQAKGAKEDRNHIQQKTTRKIAIIGKEHMHKQTHKNQFRTSYSQSSRTK
jgi:hypothetical protein